MSKSDVPKVTHSGLPDVTPDQHGDTRVRSKVVDESAIGDDKILVYKSGSDTLVYEAKPSGGGTPESVLMGCFFACLGGMEIKSTGGTVVKESLGAKIASSPTGSWVGYAFYSFESDKVCPSYFNKNPQFEFLFMYNWTGEFDNGVYVIVGGTAGSVSSPSHKKFGFQIIGGQLQIVTSDGTTQSNSGNLIAIAVNTWYRIRCKLTSGNKVEIWVDGVSKGTKTTNLPSGDLTANHALPQIVAQGDSVSQELVWYGHLRLLRDY